MTLETVIGAVSEPRPADSFSSLTCHKSFSLPTLALVISVSSLAQPVRWGSPSNIIQSLARAMRGRHRRTRMRRAVELIIRCYGVRPESGPWGLSYLYFRLSVRTRFGIRGETASADLIFLTGCI